jgi:hypothetical protein
MAPVFCDIGERFSGHDVHVDAGRRSNNGKLLMFLHSGRALDRGGWLLKVQVGAIARSLL